jgi:phosphatidylglycerol:prolipoprotein diacylglycerol transferase
MLAAAGVFVLARRLLPRPAAVAALPWDHKIALVLAAFIGGTLGAKLPFAVGSGQPLGSEAAWLADGKTVTTGLIGGYLGVELIKLVLGIRVKTGDTFALPLALAMTVGRWGCFCNGCCHGTATDLPWGVVFLDDGLPRHPTQVYESAFHAAMAIVLVQLHLRGLLAGHRLQFYLIGYGIYRFLTELIRPEPAWWGPLTFYQVAAAGLAAGLALQWAWEARHPPAGGSPG